MSASMFRGVLIAGVILFGFISFALGVHRGEAQPPPAHPTPSAAATTAPDRLDEIDRLRLENLILQRQIVARQQHDIEQRLQVIQGELQTKHHVTPADRVDVSTGIITRGISAESKKP